MGIVRRFAKQARPKIVSVGVRDLSRDEREANRAYGSGWGCLVITYADGTRHEGALVLTVPRSRVLALQGG